MIEAMQGPHQKQWPTLGFVHHPAKVFTKHANAYQLDATQEENDAHQGGKARCNDAP